MGDRTLTSSTEERLPHGPYWTVSIDRSANGAPGIFVTITHGSASKLGHDEMSVYVKDGNEFLKPVIAWLAANPTTPESEKKE